MDMINTLQRTLGAVRGAAQGAGRFAGAGVGRVRNLRPKPKRGMDDITLARKVESIVFRGPNAPKGTVDVNVVDGVVQLRGTVKRPDQVKKLEAQVRAVPEVQDVENLLKTPKTPARTRADSPPRTRKGTTGGAKGTARAAKDAPKGRGARTTAERRTARAEPSGDELARRRAGRQPAPLGAKDTGTETRTRKPSAEKGSPASGTTGAPTPPKTPATGTSGAEPSGEPGGGTATATRAPGEEHRPTTGDA